jgi:hypothetical protein
MDEIQMHPVESSNIAAIGFREADSTLRVQFTNGASYEAPGATKADFDAFLAAKSKGVHFHKVIKSAFAFKKVEKKG